MSRNESCAWGTCARSALPGSLCWSLADWPGMGSCRGGGEKQVMKAKPGGSF